MDEQEDFCNRCIALSRHLYLLETIEPSPRVWISVMSHKMAELAYNTEDIEGAIEQIVTSIRHSLEGIKEE